MTSYKKWYEMIKVHLGTYKVNVLDIKEDGIWKGNGRLYSHILPLEQGDKNYLCDEAKKALKDDEKHQDWYHLNSSQTLCVNFFAPLKEIDGGKYLNLLMTRLFDKKIAIKDSCFEYVPIKNSTNFDFYAKDESNGQYFFEIKYTEDGITKSGGGKTPFKAYELFYKKDVEANPTFANIDANMFVNKHFQAYRNMVKGNGIDYSIFITMRSNPNTSKELESSISDLGVTALPNIKILYWEDLIDLVIKLVGDNNYLNEYYKKLKTKYIPKL